MNRSGRARGFSMIEVTVSAAVLAVAALMLLGAFFSSLALDTLNREQVWARQACKQQLEGILAMPFTTITTMNGATFDVSAPVNGLRANQSNALKSPFPLVVPKVGKIVVDSTVSGDAKCYKVTVSATWATGHGEQASLSFTVDIADNL